MSPIIAFYPRTFIKMNASYSNPKYHKIEHRSMVLYYYNINQQLGYRNSTLFWSATLSCDLPFPFYIWSYLGYRDYSVNTSSLLLFFIFYL